MKKKRSGKPRSAKQLANDKRLGRMAKARAALARKANPKRKKRKVAKRKAKKNPNVLRKRQAVGQRRTNPKRKKRKVSARSHLWLIFKCKGNSVYFAALKNGKVAWVRSKTDAVLSKTKRGAHISARFLTKRKGMSGWSIGIASDDITSAQIKAGCEGKA